MVGLSADGDGTMLVFKSKAIEIWAISESWGTDYWVYGVTASGDPRVCPSLGMAHEVAACAS
jgi:hypothetical protein